jgi:hypothetical protein
MPTMSPAKTKRYVVLAMGADGKLRIVSVHHDEGKAHDRFEALDDERIDAKAHGDTSLAAWYAVREGDHEYVAQAVANMRLSAKQRKALLDLASVLPRPGMTIRPGYEIDRWYGRGSSSKSTQVYPTRRMDTTDLSQVAKGLANKGLVMMTGVAYGPKTYRMTDLGRLVASHLEN